MTIIKKSAHYLQKTKQNKKTLIIINDYSIILWKEGVYGF